MVYSGKADRRDRIFRVKNNNGRAALPLRPIFTAKIFSTEANKGNEGKNFWLCEFFVAFVRF
jgi:ATP phosphoribosyltransferase regulatory subunit HisZ